MSALRPEPKPRGLGIAAGLEAGLARDLAARCEQLGYHSLWSNDEPAASGLETLAHFAAAAPRLELGVGVLPLDRHSPARIATEIDRLEIDPAKLWIGIGSGQLGRQIDALQRAVAELREVLPRETRLVVAAMRPRLCRLGWRRCRRRPPELDAARPRVKGAALGPGRRRRRRPRPTCRRFIRSRRGGLRLAPAASRRGRPVPHHQRGPSQALRHHGCPARKPRRGRVDATRGARETGAVPVGA